jgi:predicted transcriptional regulator
MLKKGSPELELMIIDSLEPEPKTVEAISKELNIDISVVTEVLDSLITEQELAIERRNTGYRLVSDDDDYIDFEDE